MIPGADIFFLSFFFLIRQVGQQNTVIFLLVFVFGRRFASVQIFALLDYFLRILGIFRFGLIFVKMIFKMKITSVRGMPAAEEYKVFRRPVRSTIM